MPAIGKKAEARASYERALSLTQQEPERRFLERRLAEFGNEARKSLACCRILRKSPNRLAVESKRRIETSNSREAMKYICLGYIEPNKFETMSETERNAMVDECFAYDDVLRKNGHFAGGEALQGPQTPRPCVGRMARCPSPMAPMPKRKNKLVASSCSKPGPEPRHPVDVEASRCEGRTVRDPPRCGPQ